MLFIGPQYFLSISLRFPSEIFLKWRLKNEKVNYSPAFNCSERIGEMGESQIKGDKKSGRL